LRLTVRIPRKQGVTGVASIINGDIIEIHGQRIRLYGIDAPESSQLCVRLTGQRWRRGQQASLASEARLLAADLVIGTATAVASHLLQGK
jgi:endonuclease YncB( thermonuclease family)